MHADGGDICRVQRKRLKNISIVAVCSSETPSSHHSPCTTLRLNTLRSPIDCLHLLHASAFAAQSLLLDAPHLNNICSWPSISRRSATRARPVAQSSSPPPIDWQRRRAASPGRRSKGGVGVQGAAPMSRIGCRREATARLCVVFLASSESGNGVGRKGRSHRSSKLRRR